MITAVNLRQWGESLAWLVSLACIALFIWIGYKAIYNAYFHPLSKFPGPKAAAATPIPFVRHLLKGDLAAWTLSLHSRYGEIVRIHPDELSFTLPEAWQDIFASRPQLVRPVIGTFHSVNDTDSFINTNDHHAHNRMRKILAPAFSERALQTQEHILQEYTDLLISRFRDQIKSAGQSPITVNLDKWYSFTTFDTIGDLCFGESFSCLERSEQHPWVESIFPGIKFGMILTLFDHFGARNYVRYLLPKSVHYKADQHAEFCRRKIDQRMRSQIERPDFISYILNQSEKNGITKDELESTAVFLLLAGSETSATTLAAATWFILKNAEVLQRVQREIRNAFSSAEDITVGIMHKLPFLHAVLQESLRLHPVSPVAVPREVDRPGTVVCGHEIPIGTRVGIPQKAAYRLPLNFVEPLSFLPERWLPDADGKFAADRKDIFEPFLVGPRNCLGQSIAWAEIKLILCKMFWTFDLQLAENNVDDWTDQKVWLLSERLPLNVKVGLRV